MGRIKRGLARFSTLRWRLTLFYCGLLVVLIFGMGWFMYSRLENFLYDGVRGRLSDYAQTQVLPVEDGRGDNNGQGRGPRGNQLAPGNLQQLSNFLASKPSGEIYGNVLDGQGQIVIPENNRNYAKVVATLPQPDQLKQAANPQGYFYYATLSLKDETGQTTGQERGLVFLQVLPARKDLPPRPPPAGGPGYILMASSLQTADDTLKQMQFLLLVGLVGSLVLAVLLGIPLARLGLRPLKKITEIARRTRSSNLSQRVALPANSYQASLASQDEVWQLAQEFNAMLDKIELAFTAQQQSEARTRQFVADASHELRSPLTVLGGYLDVLLMGAKDNPLQAKRIMDAMRSEITRLSRLVIDLLMLTRLDSGSSGVVQIAPVEVEELLNRTASNMGLLMGQRRLEVKLAPGSSPVWIQGDADQLYRVLVNLVDNAIRYTGDQGYIGLSLSVEKVVSQARPSVTNKKSGKTLTEPSTPNETGNEWVVIRVRDDGCGIAPEQLAHIFDRFYRADESRTRQTGNAGLGLAISKGIIEAHGGLIEVESQLGNGTTFIIRLPLLGLELETDGELSNLPVEANRQ